MLRAVICDWNRTLFGDEYEIEFFLGLAKRAAMTSFAGLKLTQLYRLWKAKKRCEARCQQLVLGAPIGIQRAALLEEIVNLMNQVLVRGLPNEVLNRYIPNYATEARKRLDQKLLRPLKRVREEHGVLLGIISSGCDVAIKETLAADGYQFDFVRANYFQRDGDTLRAFKLEIFDNKLEVLKVALLERKIKLDNVMYIGDDWQDHECLQAVRFPIISFLARAEVRADFQRTLNAFVPNTEEEFERCLCKALA